LFLFVSNVSADVYTDDISISAGYDDHRVKRATDKNAGWLKSKNIKAGLIKSFYIKSKNVIADKILGDNIIADSVYVSRDIRNKKKQESGNRHSHASNAIEHCGIFCFSIRF
jgi:hypothetical protein